MYSFNEPVKGHQLRFELLSEEVLTIPRIQREISDNHVKKLMDSISKVGFIEPITVVEGEDGKYEIINGQHRFEAGKNLGMTHFPAVVLPKELKDYIIHLNIEKAPNIRDKAHQAYEIYRYYVETQPEMEEFEIYRFVERAYYVTVGILIDEFLDKYFPASAFESFLNRFDDFINATLKDAYEERKRRAKKLQEAKRVLNEKYKEIGVNNPNMKNLIVNKAIQMAYGKARRVDEDFYTAIEKLMENMKLVNFYSQREEDAVDIEF